MAKDFSAVFGKKTAQEEEDRRRAEEAKKKAEEEAGKKAEKTYSEPKQAVSSAGTKQGLNDSMAKRLGAEKGLELIEKNKQKKAAKAAFDASFMKEKQEAAKTKNKPEPMSGEEIYRLLSLDESKTQKRIDELKAGRRNFGTTAQAVAAGRNAKSPVTGKAIGYDEERENEIRNLERDILLHGQLRKEYEFLGIQSDPTKMEAGAKGYESWLLGKEAAKAREQEERAGQSGFEEHVLNSWNNPDMSLPSGGFAAAVNAYREDTSENEPSDQWTEEQKRIFGYFYSIGNYAKAAEYARNINNANRSAENQKIIDGFKAWAMKNGGTKFVSDLGSVVTAGLDGIGYLDALAQQAAQGYITESAIPLPGDIRNAYRSERTEELNERFGTLGDSDIGLGTGYSVMMSSLDSMFAAFTGGKTGALINAFGGSASAALDDALERGATSEQALGYATLVGGAELLPEYMSVDSLFRLMDAKDAWTIIGNIGKQAGTEGLEGFITALSAKGVDDVIMGEISNFNVAVNELMLAGYSREEAEYLARKDEGSGIIFDTIAEALGGGFSGGVVTGIKTAAGGNKTEVPVPFEGNAQPGTEQGMVADKIAEIENRSISDAEKAAKMEEVAAAVLETTGNPEVIAEAEKFRNIHEERSVAETQQNPGETVAETQQGLFGPEIVGKILGLEPVETKTDAGFEPERLGNFIPAIRANIDEISKMRPVARITENMFPKEKGKLTETVWQFFQSLGGKVTRENFGDVVLAKSGIKKSVISGMSEEKAKAFEIVPEVIKQGKQVDFQTNFKGRGYNTYTFAAPYETEKGKRIVGVIVKKDSNSNRYYLHEVVDEEGNLIFKNKETTDDTSKSGPGYRNQVTGVSSAVSDTIISPASDKFNPPSIGNSVFGPEIYNRIFGVEDPKVQAQMDEVSEIGNRLGIDVAFSRDIISDGLHTADGRIYINPDAKNPLRQVLVHELTHEIESSGLYENFSETILDYAQRVHGADLESMRREIREDYSIIGQEIETVEDADKEIVAKFAEQYLFSDENSINRLCNTNPNLFQRIRYWISDMIVKFRGTSEEQFLRNAEKLYARAWATRGEIQGAGVGQASIANIVPYGDVVYLDTTLYDGLTDAERKEMVKARVKELGGQTFTAYDQHGNAVDINIVTSKRFKNSRGKTTPANNDLRTKFIGDKTKQEAIDLIDELVLTSTFDGTDPARHPHDWIDNYGKNDWEKWKTYLIDKNNTIWEARLNVATSANGEKILYDIDPIKKVGQAGNSATSSLINNVPQKSGNVNGQNNSQNNTPAFGRSYEEMLNAQNLSTEQAETTPSMKRADGKKTAEDWKNIAERIHSEHKGIWRMKDFSRVLDQASGNDKGLRQQLYELYEKPLNEAQGSYAKKYAEKAKQITAKFKELGIKAKSNESKAVQRIGEGVKEISKRGETAQYTLDDLKKDFPDSWQQIKEGADFCREVYDEFLHDLNAMYESIYPATVEQAREQISSYDNAVLRYENKIEHFREVIKNLEAEKAEKQNQLSKKKPTTLIYAQLQSQIDNIDGRIAKAESIIGRLQNRELVKKISRETLNAQIENGEILRNKQIKPRKDYFRHFQELTNEFAEIADIFSNDQRIPPNLAGKSADTKPRTIWTSIAQSRAGENYYTEDAVGGLLQYTEIAEKLLAFDPLISHFRDANSAIRAAAEMADNEVKGKGTNAGQFAAYADKLTNMIAGKSDTIDRWLSDEWGANGRAIMKAVEVLNRRVKSNAILGNFRSAIVQIGNLPNASLYIQNPIDWVKGAVTLLNGLERDENIRNARARSNFMNRRYMGDAIDELTKEIQSNNILDKQKEFALWMLGAGDRFGAELIWHTAYTKALNNPRVLEGRERGRAYESAIDYADDITRRSVGGRAEGDVPLHMDSKWYSLIAPFQIEVANTFNAAKEAFGDKNWVGLAAFEISVFFMNNLLEGITGDRPLGLDFIQAAIDVWMEATGADDEDEEEKDFWDIATYAAGRFGGEFLSGMPLGTQIGSFITGGDEQKAEDWLGDSDPTRYGTGNIGISAVADAAEYFIDGETPKKLFEFATDGHKNSYEEWSAPVLETLNTFSPVALPWGGKQLSRTLQGADQIIRGGTYGTEADGTEYLKFLQGKELEDFYKTLLFGRYASDAGQEYIDSGFSTSLSGKQTQQMKLAEQWGIANKDFYDLVIELRGYKTKEEKQLALMENENFTSGEKGILEQIIFGKAGEGYDSRDYSGMEDFYISGLSETEKRLYAEGYYGGKLDGLEKAIKAGKNKEEKIANIMEEENVSEEKAFEILQKRNGDWISELSEEESARASGAEEFYGMSTENYLAVLNAKGFGGDSKAEIIESLMNLNAWDAETAEENYNRVFVYEYSREDISEEQAEGLETAQSRYGVDDFGYFVARNAIKTAEGETDKYGNTVSGSKKAAAIKAIARELGIDESEAAVYYLAANGDLALSASDLSSAKQADLEEAMKYGWTEIEFLNAVNIVKLAGATKKADIIEALVAAGATYEMAYGYYNLQQNNDYYKR